MQIESLEPRRLLTAAVESALPMRVNAGGDFYTDLLARTFQPDAGFSGSATQVESGYDVAGTDDDPLFLSYRSGTAFSFSAAAPNGHYSLWLEFAEPNASAIAGQRVFSVQSGSTTLLNNFDITASAGGVQLAVAKNFDVTITGGSLDLSFAASSGEALIDAIVLTPTDPPTESAAYSWQHLSEPAAMGLDQSHLRNIGTAILLYSNDNRGKFPPDFKTVDQDVGVTADTFISPRSASMIPRGTMSLAERSAWIDARNDYIYRGAGQRNNLPADYVVAYDNPNRVLGNINILYGDGHVGSLTRSDAAALIGFPDAPPSDPPPPPPVGPAPAAKVLQSQSNLLSMAQNLFLYSNQHAGRFPVLLGDVAMSMNLPATLFVNPRSTTKVPANSWTSQEKADWINANSDYVYLGAGKRTSQFVGDDVLAYEKSAGMTGGINLLMGDGHVEFREFGWADETLARVIAPAVRDASLQSPVAGQQSLRFHFTEDVATTLPSLMITYASGNPVPGSPQLAYDWPLHTATFSFPALAAGRYHATLATPGISNFSYDFVYVPSGQRLALPAGQNFILQSINLDAGATLDLSGNVLLDFTDVRGNQNPEATVRALLQSGYASGNWSGKGLTSSAAIGTHAAIAYASAVDLGLDQFSGQSIDATSVLLKYTYAGDANLDGKLNGDDYFAIDAHAGQSGGSVNWFSGDFDYNGRVDADDYFLIDVNYNKAPAAMSLSAGAELPTSSSTTATALRPGLGESSDRSKLEDVGL